MGNTGTVAANATPTPQGALDAGLIQALAVAVKPILTYAANLQQPGANTETAMQGIPEVELQEAANSPIWEQLGINVGGIELALLTQKLQTALTNAILPAAGSTTSSIGTAQSGTAGSGA
jgi:hypothetical protein